MKAPFRFFSHPWLLGFCGLFLLHAHCEFSEGLAAQKEGNVVEGDQSNELNLLHAVLGEFKEAAASRITIKSGPDLLEIVRSHDAERFLQPIAVSNYISKVSVDTPTITTIWKEGHRYGIHWPSKTVVSIVDESRDEKTVVDEYPLDGYPDFALSLAPHNKLPDMLKLELYFLPNRILEINELDYDPQSLQYGFIGHGGRPKPPGYEFYGFEYGIDSADLKLRYAIPKDSLMTRRPDYYRPMELLDQASLAKSLSVPQDFDFLEVNSETEWKAIWESLLADVLSDMSKERPTHG